MASSSSQNNSSITEDDVTNTIIRRYRKSHQNRIDNESVSSPESDLTLVPEAHYNHYGDRGAVDLYTQEGVYTHLYEVKSDAAIRSATGANEIIRQFNRLRENFFAGSDFKKSHFVTYELTFVPSPLSLEHILSNYDLYRESVHLNAPPHGNNFDTKSIITFRAPGSTSDDPGLLFTQHTTIRELISIFGEDGESELDFLVRSEPLIGKYLTECLP